MYGVLAYLTILATSILGLAGVSPTLTILPAAVVLTMIGNIEHRTLYKRACDLGSEGTAFAAWTLARSFGNGFIACAAGYGLGFVVRLVSGL